jgi:hypothetical protein
MYLVSFPECYLSLLKHDSGENRQSQGHSKKRIENIQYEAGSSVKNSAGEYCRKSLDKCVLMKV